MNVDVFGLGSPGGAPLGSKGVVSGTLVGLAPGAFIVRLDGQQGTGPEITVGRSRVQHASAR